MERNAKNLPRHLIVERAAREYTYLLALFSAFDAKYLAG
jgi:hypothetical protein